MKKKTPYLDFYKKCLTTMELPVRSKSGGGGLCEFFNDRLFLIIRQSVNDYDWDNNEKYERHAYWGAGLPFNNRINRKQCQYGFTPLRQNIVLLMAAMNNEL